jgi:23S rRNA (adenine-N6)-dimethyltransferase
VAAGRPSAPPGGWGWHPLVDAWAARVVADAGIRPGELVYDIGAGHGALTGPLLAAGARVIAVELHPRRARLLRLSHPDATVLEIDARDLRVPHRPFRVVANPPYAIASPLIRLLLARGSALTGADLVLQRALVRRMVAGGPIGRWHLRDGRPLPRHAFRPAPRVDSTVLIVRR